MALRCLLFTTDMGSAAPIRHVLADLAVEVEHCTEATAAADNVSSQPFQIVIIDWDVQPEAAVLLQTARERKVSERPLTLAIVSDDGGVPKALQAGANSILRKPVQTNQVKDTLKRARDLLRARESAASAAQAAAAGAGPVRWPGVATGPSANAATLRARGFLQSSAPASPTQSDTESEMQKSLEQSAAQDVHVLRDLEPTAAAVVQEKPAPPLPPRPEEPHGLQWYLNQRAAATASAPTQVSTPVSPSRPELLRYDQPSSYSSATAGKSDDSGHGTEVAAEPNEQEKKAEAELFAYLSGEGGDSRKEGRPRGRLGKGAIIGALALAACAIVAAPQAPWHPQLRTLWTRARQTVHGWLNPQLVTPAQAPASHEDFGQAGDEYKLPVAESIPDATTDPSQIRVMPVVDPTVKKPNSLGGNEEPNGVPAEGSATNPGDATQQGQSPPQQTQSNSVQGTSGSDNSAPSNSPPQPVAVTVQPVATPAAAAPKTQPAHSNPFKPSPALALAQPTPPRNPKPRPTSTSPTPPIPSSLRSQMASMTPDTSGNKAPETALPSIEPVDVAEAAERALLTDQPPIPYPANAETLQGTVVLQVLVGRDGTVQDAKFLQGSLAFARTAIDGVKQWKFKPYTMNGRAVSVQTKLTLSFRPAQ